MIVVLCAFAILKEQLLLTAEQTYYTSKYKNLAYFIPMLRLFALEECEALVTNTKKKAKWLSEKVI